MPLLLAAQGATAQQASQPPGPVVGVLDMQRVLREAGAAKQARADRERYASQYKAEVSEQEKSLRAADQELARQRTVLAPEAFNEKRKEFQQRLAQFQRDVQARRRNLERAMAEAMSEIQRAVVTATDEAATQRGVNLVLYRSQVFMFSDQMDLTPTVLEKVNRQLPSVAFPDPATMAPGGN
ncbi:OmpH family outer membrane protein [Roseospirillum parvum]|uniref:OmpH family outer membrane protein n=1 Tax=Roseospirillum parvum TaxID=83401 RepID=UPI0015A2F914|nr:OmpH family outer membrane protein [Roseospirillum parvum]